MFIYIFRNRLAAQIKKNYLSKVREGLQLASSTADILQNLGFTYSLEFPYMDDFLLPSLAKHDFESKKLTRPI